MNLSFQQMILAGGLVLLTACGSSFKSGSSDSSSAGTNSGQDVGTPVPTPVTPVAPVNPADFKGIISSGNYANLQAFGIDLPNNQFLFSVPLSPSILLSLNDTPISGITGAHVYTSVAADGSKALVLAIPFKNFLRNVTLPNLPNFPVKGLPSGDLLPQVAAGKLPSTTFTLGGKDNVILHLYFGSDTVAFFVETNFNPVIGLGYDILNSTKDRLGNLSLVPTNGQFRPGVFLSMALPAKLARQLDKYVQ